MANNKYTINIPIEQINRFEAFLDAGNTFVYFKYEKMDDDRYIIEGTVNDTEPLVKKYDCGLIGVTNTAGYSSAEWHDNSSQSIHW